MRLTRYRKSLSAVSSLILPLLLLVFILVGCGDGLNLPGRSSENSDGETILSSEAEGESVLLIGVKSDIPSEGSTGVEKGKLEPQANGGGQDNPSPYITRSLTVTVDRIQLISAQLDADDFPVYDSSGTIQMNPNLAPIDIYTGSATVDLMDPTQLDNLFFTNSISIPTQTIGNQTDRYNKLEVTVSNPHLEIDCNSKSGKDFRSGKDFQRLSISGSQIFIVKSISNVAPSGGAVVIKKPGALVPQAKFTDRRDMDFGFGADNLIASNKFLINITEPLIVNNGIVKLVMDPLGNTPGAGVDVHPANGHNPSLGCQNKKAAVRWIVMPFGSARFLNDYVATGTVPGGPFLLEGTIMQVEYDATDPTAISPSQLPYPDPGAGNFWMQLQLNGSGGGLGSMQKVSASPLAVLKKSISANGSDNAADAEAPHGLSAQAVIRTTKPDNILYPQSAFTFVESGDLDIIAFSDKNPAKTYFYRNTGVIGSATWAARQTVDDGSTANAMGMFGNIALGDFDTDGDLDAVTGYRGGEVVLYENTGSGWVSGVSIANIGQDITGVEAADFDNDGDVDIVFAGNDKKIRFYNNTGSGSFSAGASFSLQDVAGALAVGYIDNDTFIDVVIGLRKGMVYWLDNDGGFSMRRVNNQDFGGADITGVTILDIDGDGDGDIAAGDTNNNITVLLNPGGISPIDFSVVKQVGGADIVMGGVEQGDVNSDGRPDLVAGFRGGELIWYDNAGGWSQNMVDMGVGASVTDIEVGDVDGDGDPDIVAGFSDQSLIYYANDGAGGFTTGGTGRPDGSVGGRVYLEIGDLDGDGGGIDAAAPAAVSDLATGFIDGTSVGLTWTASGDDGMTGTATSYDIRYSTSPIISSNFNSAIQVSGTPVPQIAGTVESFTVFGLLEGTVYYFALKSIDDVGRISFISNVVSAATSVLPDSIPPGTVIDLAVTGVTPETASLSWTAVGDDNNVGTATLYDLRYSRFPINEGNFNAATSAGTLSAPRIAGTPETFTVSGLAIESTYYFAIKVTDNVGNISGLSSVPQGITLNLPNDTVRNFGRPILVRVVDTTVITDYMNEPLTGTLTPYSQLGILAKRVDNAMVGTAVRVRGELVIETNPFTGGQFTVDPVNIGNGGIFSITPSHVRVIEKPQSSGNPPPNDKNIDPRTFQVLSADNPTLVAAITKLSGGITFQSVGGLTPQRRVNSLPPRPASISMIINDMRIIQAEINSSGFPVFNGVSSSVGTGGKKGSSTPVSSVSAVENIDGNHPGISLISGGSSRFELFDELQFNNLFASKTIPPDPCFSSSTPESCTRYNMIEVSYDTSSLRIVTTQGEVVNNSGSSKNNSTSTIEIRQQLENSSGISGFNDFTYREIGKIYIRITTPQIFPNSLNVLKIDPLGSANVEIMANVLQVDTRWVVFPIGIARFEVSSTGMTIPGGPYTMEGVVIQQHDINASANLPLPNTPTLSDFWVQLTQEDRAGAQCSPLCDPVGTAGAPLLMRISDIGQGSTVISDTLGSMSPDIPGMTPTDEFRFLATKFDASVIGTRVKISGEVSLAPDPGGFALGTLVVHPASSVQVLDAAGQ